MRTFEMIPYFAVGMGIFLIQILYSGMNEQITSRSKASQWNELNVSTRINNGDLEADIRIVLPKFNLTSQSHFKECNNACDCTSQYDGLGMILLCCSVFSVFVNLILFCQDSANSKEEYILPWFYRIILFITLFWATGYFIETYHSNSISDLVQNVNQARTLAKTSINSKRNILEATHYNLDGEFLSVPVMLKIPISQLAPLCHTNVCKCGITPAPFIPLCLFVIGLSFIDSIGLYSSICDSIQKTNSTKKKIKKKSIRSQKKTFNNDKVSDVRLVVT